MSIPTNTVKFFKWVKKRTEHYWSKEYQDSIADKDDVHKCAEWLIDAKWTGFSEAEIEEVERKYSVKFTREHKLFLQILHSVNRKQPASELTSERPFFYNWIRDEEEIRAKMNWAFEQILFDVLNNKTWIESWGERPKTQEMIKEVFKKQFDKSSVLLPIYTHRFILNEYEDRPNIILSIWGSDTIIYGKNFRHYLLNEIRGSLNLSKQEQKEVDTIGEREHNNKEYRKLPFWGEIIDANS